MSPARSASRRSRLAVVALVTLLAATGCGLGADLPSPGAGTGHPSVTAPTPDAAPVGSAPGVTRAELTGATDLLERQSAALSAQDRARFLAGWAPAPAAQRRAAAVYADLSALHVAAPHVHVVAATLPDDRRSWSADVDLAWRMIGSAGVSESRLTYRLAGPSSRPVIESIVAAEGRRLPIWLLPDVVVRRTPHTLVVAGKTATADRVSRLLTAANAAVRHVLPGWRGSLVAYAPPTTSGFTALIAAQPHEYDGIAAVTTTVDGSDRSSAPVAIVLNPTVLGRLGPIGAHVVVTHEATHVATGAATATMPLWIAEGFADYVGIGSTDIATTVAARAAIAEVRRDGAPRSLPDDTAFAVGGDALEATYEQAWLAVGLIARRYGGPAVVAFYHWVQAHPDAPGAAFRAVLHTSRAAFTSRWHDELQELAGGR